MMDNVMTTFTRRAVAARLPAIFLAGVMAGTPLAAQTLFQSTPITQTAPAMVPVQVPGSMPASQPPPSQAAQPRVVYPVGAPAAASAAPSVAPARPQAPPLGLVEAPLRPAQGQAAAPLPSSSAPAGSAPIPAVRQPAPPPIAPAAQPLPAAVTAPRPAATVEAGAPRPAGGAQVLRHLPNNTQGYRLAGEIGASEWPIFLTDAQAGNAVRFQLGYLSAVSVMPEGSRIIVQLNDVVVGETPVQAPYAVKTVIFDVPRELVKPGFNSLRISVQQRHRVDCTLPATYELWTQIDPSQTGFLFAGADAGVTNIADMPALPPNPQGAFPIRAVLPARTESAHIDRLMRAVQAIAIAGRFEQPLVDTDAGLASDGYGLNVAVGTVSQLRLIGGLGSLRDPAGPLLSILPASGGRRATIVVTGNTEAEVDQAMARLSQAVPPRGSEAGLRTALAFPGLRVTGGERVTLRDFGITSQEFSGRLFRTGFQIIMPADFYPADYAKVSLFLDGGYAGGLTREAQIIVNINGRNAVGVALPKGSGETFRGRLVSLPLGMMRPGLNRIDIEAHLPTADDASCDPLQVMSQKQRFLLLDSTALVIPSIARIATMPDLAATATGAFPYARRGQESQLYIPTPDRETLGAAATLIARMAVSGGEPARFRLTTVKPDTKDGPILAVGASNTIDDAVLEAAGVDRAALRAAWEGWSDAGVNAMRDPAVSRFELMNRYNIALQRNFPAECRMRAPPRRERRAQQIQQSAPEQTATLSDQLYQRWRQDQRESSSVYAWGRVAVNFAGEIGKRAVASWFALFDQLSPPKINQDQNTVITQNASLLMGQLNHGGEETGVWTLATAPTPAALRESMGCMVDPRVWQQVEGRLAALDSSEAKIAAMQAADLRFVVTQPLSIGNARLIAAGWFSLNRWTFVGLMIFVGLLLGSSTFFLVRGVGRRQT